MTSITFLFPGQGSQSVGMLSDIAEIFPEIISTFEEASKVLDYNLWQIVKEGPAIELDKTARTQPALLAASYAIFRILQKNPAFKKPSQLAGHSLGEYTALVVGGALDFQDAIRLVAARGEFMQEACPPGQGGLAAIVGLEDAVVQKICEQSIEEGEILSPANFNSPGQVVISGHLPAVSRALVLAKEAGARLAKLLPVSVPSHSFLMKPAAEKLSALLKTTKISPLQIPVLNNVDVAWYDTADSIRDGLRRQLFMPVRWVETMQKLAKNQNTRFIECGPGKVLTGLNKRILPEGTELTNTSDLASLQPLLELK